MLLNAYSSTIISYLTASNLLPVAKTVEDVAHGHPQNVKMLTEKDGIIAARSLVCPYVFFNYYCPRNFNWIGYNIRVKNATTGTYKLLGDSLRQHPDSMFLDRLEGFKKLFTVIQSYLKRKRNCCHLYCCSDGRLTSSYGSCRRTFVQGPWWNGESNTV